MDEFLEYQRAVTMAELIGLALTSFLAGCFAGLFVYSLFAFRGKR